MGGRVLEWSRALEPFLPSSGSGRSIGPSFGPNARITGSWMTNDSPFLTIEISPEEDEIPFLAAVVYHTFDKTGWRRTRPGADPARVGRGAPRQHRRPGEPRRSPPGGDDHHPRVPALGGLHADDAVLRGPGRRRDGHRRGRLLRGPPARSVRRAVHRHGAGPGIRGRRRTHGGRACAPRAPTTRPRSWPCTVPTPWPTMRSGTRRGPCWPRSAPRPVPRRRPTTSPRRPATSCAIPTRFEYDTGRPRPRLLRYLGRRVLRPHQARLLRVLRLHDGGAAARDGRPDALRPGPAAGRWGARIGTLGRAQPRFARLGPGVLPRLRLGRLRPDGRPGPAAGPAAVRTPGGQREPRGHRAAPGSCGRRRPCPATSRPAGGFTGGPRTPGAAGPLIAVAILLARRDRR